MFSKQIYAGSPVVLLRATTSTLRATESFFLLPRELCCHRLFVSALMLIINRSSEEIK
jgi:hypothetical protein